MGQTAEELRVEIEAQRIELGNDLGRLEDHVRPRRMVERRVGRMRSGVSSVRDRVMGAAGDVQDRAGDALHEGMEGVHHAPEMVKHRTQGSPLTAGLVAFGAGLVVAAALPPTRMEVHAAERLEPALQPVKDEMAQMGSEVADEVKASGSDAVSSLKERADEARQNVMDAAPTPGRGR